MNQQLKWLRRMGGVTILLGMFVVPTLIMAQTRGGRAGKDPAEPQQGRPQLKAVPRLAAGVARASVDDKSMKALIEELVACGTRLSLSSWTDPKRGIGCGRDHIVARMNAIAKQSGGKLQVVVDKFESTSERTSGKP